MLMCIVGGIVIELHMNYICKFKSRRPLLILARGGFLSEIHQPPVDGCNQVLSLERAWSLIKVEWK